MRTCMVSGSLFAFILLSISQATPSRAANATHWVANDGTDTGACGAQSTPCRSISQAIENATDGDTIEVGEGRYGDITGTGTFAAGGDEHAHLLPQDGCIVCVTKAVRIFSLHGAAVTLIQGRADTQFPSTVIIAHDGVTFGDKDHGFTLTGGNRTGLAVVLNVDVDYRAINIVAPIRIGGNIDVGDGTGFRYQGPILSDSPCPACQYTGQVLISDNEASSNNDRGFNILLGQRDVEPIILQNNTARNGGTGFYVSPGPIGESAFILGAAGNVSFVDNISTGNAAGFNTTASGDIRGNTASGNSQWGFFVVPNSGVFAGNSAIGNGGPGVIVQYSKDSTTPDVADDGPTSIPRFRTFSNNDFYGNDRNRPPLTMSVYMAPNPTVTYNPGPGAHCGVLNVGALNGPINGVPGVAITLPATGNFWGSAKGPSATGPGDAAGGACDQNNATTIFKPFATAFL
jgi:hypothetical protein